MNALWILLSFTHTEGITEDECICFPRQDVWKVKAELLFFCLFSRVYTGAHTHTQTHTSILTCIYRLFKWKC